MVRSSLSDTGRKSPSSRSWAVQPVRRMYSSRRLLAGHSRPVGHAEDGSLQHVEVVGHADDDHFLFQVFVQMLLFFLVYHYRPLFHTT